MNLFMDLNHLLISSIIIISEIANPFAWMWIILFSAFMIYVFIISPIFLFSKIAYEKTYFLFYSFR